MLAGARSFTAIGEWAANASEQVLAALGTAGFPPSESCVRGALQNLDGDQLDAALGEWGLLLYRPTPVCTVDGKTVRGARAATGAARHLMAAIDHHAGVVIGQVNVEGKTNEIPMRGLRSDGAAGCHHRRCGENQQDALHEKAEDPVTCQTHHKCGDPGFLRFPAIMT